RKLWNEFSRQGVHAVEEFNWQRHASVYHDLIDEIIGNTEISIPDQPRSMLVCDIDNTLIGCKTGLNEFRNWRMKEEGLLFGIASGRSFHSAQSVLAREKAPHPAFIISSVGSSIFLYDQDKRQFYRDLEWDEYISQDWEPDKIRSMMGNLRHSRLQSSLEQTDYKLSYFTDGEEDAGEIVTEMLLQDQFSANVIVSHGKFLDIIPGRASKGTAVEYLRKKNGLPVNAVIAAGDSGNDVEMLKVARSAIIVGNHIDGVTAIPALKHSYVAKATHAAGVLEGVKYFRRNSQLKNG